MRAASRPHAPRAEPQHGSAAHPGGRAGRAARGALGAPLAPHLRKERAPTPAPGRCAMAKMIYEVLEREHRMVTDLLQRAQRAGASEREDLLEQAMQELISHSEAESETFYAAL